ncbi:MAG: hypothetical protein SHS37scaffold537_9 [Phage 68_12]|nr:MAG: hypothetical protein SHS37scaffold537_9 [Phage 68_12]
MSAVIRIDILGDSKSAQRSTLAAERGYDRLGRGADRSSGKVSKFGGALAGAARRFGPLAAAAATAGVVKFGFSAISAASRLQQAFGAIDAVFGKNSAVVKQWARRAATDVGLAKSEYAELATVLGSMLKNTGIKDFTGETQDLIFKGADLAAQFGGTTKDAIEAISSLLRGELDPIERYGVSIKQSAINAELAAKGLGKLTGRAKTQAEQQARLKLLNDQTASSYKAFSRESDTLAQKQQVLGARWENLKATIGQKLLPVATKLVSWLADTVEGSNNTGKAIKRLAQIYASVVQPTVEGAVRGWKKFTAGLDDATGESNSLGKAVNKVGDFLEKAAPILGKFYGTYLEALGTAAGEAARMVGRISKAIQTMIGWVDTALDKLGQLAKAAKSGGSLGLGSLGGPFAGLGGLFSSGASLPGGLGRAAGIGALGFGGGGSIRVSAPTVNLVVLLDGRELKHVARREARDEISTQVLATKRTR